MFSFILSEILASQEFSVIIIESETDEHQFNVMDINVVTVVLIQMSDLTQEKCMEIINRYEPMTEARENGQLLIDGNFILLHSCILLIQIMYDSSYPP